MPLNSSLGLYPCGPCTRAAKSIIAKKFIKIKPLALREQDNIRQGFYAGSEDFLASTGGAPCRLRHGFYKLPDININTATLSRFGAPAARRLWDTIKSEGLKQGGIGKIKSSVETETERLNREVKEAIASGTAKIISKNIDFDEKTEKGERESITTDWTKKGLSKMALMMRGDYHGQRLEEISSANQENLKHGYYVLSEEEKKILRENNNDISSIYKALEEAGHELLPDLRKKAGLEENRRNAGSNHEENRLFLPTKKAKEEIKKFCGEDIRIFNNLFPAFNGNISENIIFCALHRSYKLGKVASALGSRMRGMLTNILEQIRNRAYAPNPWDEVLGNPAFAEWPLKEYGQRLKTYKESLQNIKQPETSWGQRAWQALGRFFPQYTEENRKVTEAEKRNREQPFRNFGHKEIDSINQKRDIAKPNSMDRRTTLQGLTMFTFQSEDLSGLNAHFRDDLIEAVEIFAVKQIQAGKKWIPVPVTDAERRTDEKQADDMLALSSPEKNLLNIYGKVENTTSGAKEKILQLIDSKIQGTLKIDLRNITILVEEKTPDQDLQSILKNMLLAVNTTDIRTYAKKALLYMLAKPVIYGNFSKHRFGQAVDISSSYSYLKDLRDYIPTYTNKQSTNVFSISSTESYTHLHIQYNWKYPEPNN